MIKIGFFDGTLFLKHLMAKKYRFVSFLFLIILWSQCSNNAPNNSEPIESDPTVLSGTGVFEFSDYEPLQDKPVNVHYHIPTTFTQTSKIVLVFHGAGRNAADYRNALIDQSDEHGFAVIVPEFSIENFPSGDAYNLGNVFVDGDNPSPNTLNPEEIWTFSLIDPIFEKIKELTSNTSDTYDVIGHSAGGQFAHRLAMFQPEANFATMIVSAPGWYTVPDIQTDFPYGFGESPLTNANFAALFSKNITIQVGELDNNPNASGLRRNPTVDVQGTNRYDRANYFYSFSENLANSNNLTFSWQLRINQGVGHDYRAALVFATNLLFN
jgi:pimeloyl-ACP methyl ester carboxylesterase